MTNLPELGTNLIPTLSTLDMKNLSHGAAEREGKKEFSPNKGAQAMGGRKVGGDQGTRGKEKEKEKNRGGRSADECRKRKLRGERGGGPSPLTSRRRKKKKR
jgi:hypothetical protein